jgi:polyisoprenyl-teichoic acid--peptidoglycan teichoic acid transferase
MADRRLNPLFAAILIVALLLAACQPVPTGPAPAATNDPGPTVVAQAPPAAEALASPESPTATPEPTETSEPTAIPQTETPAPPTETPEPTLTPTPSATIAPRGLTETDNYLVLGIDPRPGDRAWRTDTIMVVAVDHEAQRIGIFSIPRDLWVNVPGLGPARINQADFHGENAKYPGGGPALVGKIVEDTFGVPIHHWVRIKQEGLVELVDALGGVEITLNCPLYEVTPHPTKPGQWEKFELPAGVNQLDGEAAKKFATFRYNSNDFYRGQRQQQLIWAIKEKAIQLDAIPKLPQLWTALQHTFQTDLGILDVIRLARVGAGLKADQVHGLTFSTEAIVYAQVGQAQVLKIGDKGLLTKELGSLWSRQSIAEQGKIGSNATCPTPTIQPTATITPLATMEPLVTPAP